MRDLYAAWNRMRTNLRKTGELRQYLAVVELTEAQAPHLHVLATGQYIRQDRLSALAERAGFGRIADIRAVRGTGPRSAAAYLVKSLARYATKANVEALAERAAGEPGGATRRQIRPVRLSRGWLKGGMARAEAAIGAELREQLAPDEPQDPGPWFVVSQRQDGSLAVVSRPKLTALAEPEAERASDSGASEEKGAGSAAAQGREAA